MHPKCANALAFLTVVPAILAIPCVLLSACLGGDPIIVKRTNSINSPTPTPTPTVQTSPTPAPSNSAVLPEGRVNGIDPMNGVVGGWAYDANTLNTSVRIEFYFNAPAGVAPITDSTTANIARQFTPVGNYGYTYNIPQTYRNGKQHRLYVYGIDTTNSAKSLLKISDFAPGPSDFFVGPTTAGLNYFNSNNLQNSFNNACGRCHTRDYYQLKTLLMVPSQFNGGSGTNNILYRKGTGLDNHGGGNVCGGGAPCSLIPTWYNNEFN
jgi:hypothetical protein